MFSSTPSGIHGSEKQEKATEGGYGVQLTSAGQRTQRGALSRKLQYETADTGGAKHLGQRPNEAKAAQGSQWDSKAPEYMGGLKTVKPDMDHSEKQLMG